MVEYSIHIQSLNLSFGEKVDVETCVHVQSHQCGVERNASVILLYKSPLSSFCCKLGIGLRGGSEIMWNKSVEEKDMINLSAIQLH